MRLTAAYRVLRVGAPPRTTAAADPQQPDVTTPETTEPSAEREPPAAVSDVPGDPTLLGPTTIGLGLLEPVALRRLLDMALDLGDVTFLDRSNGLLEVVVEFEDAPTSSVVLTVSGHPDGSRIDCWVEPLSGGPAPPADAVTRLVLRELRGDDPAD